MNGVTFSNKPTRTYTYSVCLVGLTVSLLIGCGEFVHASWMAKLDYFFLDTCQRLFASDRPATNTVVVDIDDASLSAVGQWPWPRYRMAALIQAIAREQPSAIGLDVLFSEPDRSSLANIQKAFRRDFDITMSFTGVPNGLLDNDGFFGEVLSQTGAVGSEYFYFDRTSSDDGKAVSPLQFGGHPEMLALNSASGELVNTYEIASQTQLSGFLNDQSDDDGRLRRLPLLIGYQGTIQVNLALAAVMKSLAATSASIESDGNGALLLVGQHRIPIDRQGSALLRFNGGSQLYPSVSAMDVLNGTLKRADVAGKIVFVGSSAAFLNDLHNTAFGAEFPGVKIQAAMAEDIVTDSFVWIPRWATLLIFAECVVSGALMSVLFLYVSGAVVALLGSAAVAGTSLFTGTILFAREGMLVSPAAPILVTLALFALFSAIRFTTEKRQAYVWFKRLENARQVTIESMAAVAETRDPETGAHIKRTQHYVRAVADELSRSGHYPDILTKDFIDILFISAPLHDIGKVGVPDHILLKPGRLTPEEFEIMKGHAEFGRKIIVSTAKTIEGDNYLIIAGEIAATHHEKWDGTGYPLGLAGQGIPLSGRIMAVADVYDALISRRCYKEPYSHEVASEFMREKRGVIFDPAVLDAFFRIESTIRHIAATYRDENEMVLGDM